MAYSRRNFLLGVPAVTAAALVVPSSATALAGPPRQSPIHIRSRRAVDAPELPELVIDYPSKVDLKVHYISRDAESPGGCGARGREETIEAEVPPGTAAVSLDGVRYELLQFHFHTPSEHLLDGHRFPLEQHFVHRGPDGATLVVGLFLDGGGRGRTVQDDVLRELPQECAEEEAEIGADLSGVLPRVLSTFRYDGSLTTTPYSEPVSWLVLRRHRAIADDTLAGFRDFFPEGDAREPQPLNGRVVRYREQR